MQFKESYRWPLALVTVSVESRKAYLQRSHVNTSRSCFAVEHNPKPSVVEHRSDGGELPSRLWQQRRPETSQMGLLEV